MLPNNDAGEHYVDTEAILRERAYTDVQIRRLCGELGKDLKLIATSEDINPQTHEQTYGPVQRRVGWYHRVKDAALIEDVLASFKRRELYIRVMAGLPDPIRSRREALHDSKGRGRSRSERRGA